MRIRRVDENQAEIVKYLRSKGCSVLVISSLGQGCPDILVGAGKVNVLLEIKNPDKPKADRQLTNDEREWIDGWRGPVFVVETEYEALQAVRSAVADWVRVDEVTTTNVCLA